MKPTHYSEPGRRFGLLLQNLGAAGVGSLFNTAAYLLGRQRRTQRARTTYILYEAFAVALMTYLIVHIIG